MKILVHMDMLTGPIFCTADLLDRHSYQQVQYPNGEVYTLAWSEAENLCQTKFNISIASYAEVDIARVNQPYQCCARGWMANQQSSFPMIEYAAGCDGPGMASIETTGQAGLFCKPDLNFSGLADTMVISVNM